MTDDAGGKSALSEGFGPLPQPLVQNYPSGKWSYTADQMRAYAMQERAAERERRAKVCEDNAHTFARHVADIIRLGPNAKLCVPGRSEE